MKKKIWVLKTPSGKIVDVGGQLMCFMSKEQGVRQFPWYKKFICKATLEVK